MQLTDLLKTLGYKDSPHLLRKGEGRLESAPAYGHIFRMAAKERGLEAVYTLRANSPEEEPLVPVVYICQAKDEDEADRTHRLVWNQDVVPFVLVNTPQSVRLYSGFRYRRGNRGTADGLLRVLKDTRSVLELAKDFHADAIDDGAIWRTWGNEVRPDLRVNWNLLENLQKLDRWLQQNGLEQSASHTLIGKYVYLRYLRDRDILSDRKLQSWNLSDEEVFGRNVTLTGVRRLIDRLDDWLNGGVFPVAFSGKHAPKQEHLRRVAATFKGDQPLDDGAWQLHLDFQAYDFSYIPIETLSVVYEQFLHAPSADQKASKGKEAGAYYTPIPVVNFMLAEMADRHPLRRGMRVLDPSCGSGAFLVQCYRKLIEREYSPQDHPGPIKLRELLQEHIFGVDRDSDACSVTELSLVLTLLDYVDPPDLEDDHRVKLPALRDKNIFYEDFFQPTAKFRKLLTGKKFDWVVGNPPWKKINPNRLSEDDECVWAWMTSARRQGKPVAGNQVAQAFAWTAGDCLSPNGQAGLLMPAMTLFEDPSRDFRSVFLKMHQVQSVANFANLAEVLFAGRSRVPAAAIFFKVRPDGSVPEHECITTYSPLVANQESTRPTEENRRQETWSIVLNASEVRDIPLSKVAEGDGLPWKIATWGSGLDERLIRRLEQKFPSLEDLESENVVIVSEGLQLRIKGASEDVEPVDEVIGKKQLDVKQLEERRHFFAFPDEALSRIAPEYAFVRKGRAKLPLSVCRPPHLIVSAARHFAIYSEEFIAVPARQIGMVSTSGDKTLLKALSLFLSSDFAFYHQFFTSPQFGVKRDVATLDALRKIPIPLNELVPSQLRDWTDLHARLVQSTLSRFDREDSALFTQGKPAIAEGKVLQELNDLVCSTLGLGSTERALVEDLVHVKLALIDGKLGREAVCPPAAAEIKRYAKSLKTELDDFIHGQLTGSHAVTVVHDDQSAMVEVVLLRGQDKNNGVEVAKAGQSAAAQLDRIRRRLRKEWGQWVYFNRNLRVYEGKKTYVLKPMQRFHWTVSQALSDASDIIAETLEGAGQHS